MTDASPVSAIEKLKQEVLGESAGLIAGAPDKLTENDANGVFVHVFTVGGQSYVIPAGTPAVLVQQVPVRPLPFSAPWFEGLIHHRGDLAPLFDLCRFFTPDSKPGAGRYLIVIGHGDDKAALRVEEVNAIKMDASLTDTARGRGDQEFVERVFDFKGDELRELNLEGLFRALAGRGRLENPRKSHAN